MNYFALSALINAISCFLLCFFILVYSRKSKSTKTFCLFLVFVGFWATFQYLWISTEEHKTALLYSRISNIFAPFISISFFHFTTHFINKFKQNKSIVFYIYIINIALTPFGVISDILIIDLQNNSIMAPYPLAGKLFPILLIEYIFLPSYSLYIIRNQIKKSKDLKYKIVFWGILIAFIGSLTNFPGCYKIPIYPYGNILIPAFIIFISYGILKHQMMDIRLIIQKNMIYTIMVILISIFYSFSIFLVEHYFKATLGYKSFLISILFALIISLLFIPLKNIIQSLTERLLFKGNFLEITKQNEQLRQEVMQTERLKSVAILASGIAHEIKNPLTPLKTFSEFLPCKLHDEEFLKKFGPIIIKEIDRIDRLVQTLLDFAKPAQLNLQTINIHSIINDTLELLSIDLIKNKINVIKNYNINTNLLLSLDPNQFKQALMNLILNSVDAMPQGGIIRIHTEINNRNRFQLRIEDTGNGIAPNDIPHIFDPFFSNKDNGTGLGLSITHEIIKNHKGKIFVKSKQDIGTTFIIELNNIMGSN